MKGHKRDALLGKAERLVLRGKKKRALAIYLGLLRAVPDDITNLNRIGDLCVRLNKTSDAAPFYRRAAEVLVDQGFYDKAIALYKKINRIDPTRIEVLEPLADLQHRQGLAAEAVGHYEAVADYFQTQKKIDRAIGVHRKIVALLPDDAPRRFRLAGLFERKGWCEAAVAEYGAIFSILLARARPEQASEVCLKAMEIDSSCLELVGQAVGELRSAGHVDEAEQLLEAAIEKNPKAAELRDGGRPVAAEMETTAETAELPDPLEIAEAMVEAAAEEDFYDLASELEKELETEVVLLDVLEEPEEPEEQTLEQVVSAMRKGVTAALSTKGCASHFDLGIAYQQMGLLAEAIAEFQLAAKDPRYLAPSCSHLASCFAEQGHPGLAIRWCERGLDSPAITEDQSLGLLAELANLHRSMGDAAAARQRLDEGREIDDGRHGGRPLRL
jgi:tetratricopeptide (TPR) repeat protein